MKPSNNIIIIDILFLFFVVKEIIDVSFKKTVTRQKQTKGERNLFNFFEEESMIELSFFFDKMSKSQKSF